MADLPDVPQRRVKIENIQVAGSVSCRRDPGRGRSGGTHPAGLSGAGRLTTETERNCIGQIHSGYMPVIITTT